MSIKTIGDGYISITGVGGTSAGTINGSLTVSGTSVFTGNVGIGTTTPRVALDIVSTSAILTPVGTTGQRPTGVAGYVRYNTQSQAFEGFSGIGTTASWTSISARPIAITGCTASDSWTVNTNNPSGNFQVHVTPAYDINEVAAIATKPTPIFTANNTIITDDINWPSGTGWSVSANVDNADAWKAFDNSETTQWSTDSSSASRIINDYITVQYPSENIVRSFDLMVHYVNNNTPWQFDIRGSNDGSTFYLVQSYTTPAADWTTSVSRNFIVSEPHIKYKYWRLFITSNNNDGLPVNIRNLRFNTGWSIGRIGLASAYQINTTDFKIVMSDTIGIPVSMSSSPISWKYNIVLTKNDLIVTSGLYVFNANNTFSKII